MAAQVGVTWSKVTLILSLLHKIMKTGCTSRSIGHLETVTACMYRTAVITVPTTDSKLFVSR